MILAISVTALVGWGGAVAAFGYMAFLVCLIWGK